MGNMVRSDKDDVVGVSADIIWVFLEAQKRSEFLDRTGRGAIRSQVSSARCAGYIRPIALLRRLVTFRE